MIDLSKVIQIPQVRVLSEDDDVLIVEFNGEEQEVHKSDKTYFYARPTNSGNGQMSQSMALELWSGVFLDRDVPKEFRELFILHELREREYDEASLKGAHERAVNDEVLYSLKFLTPELRERYSEFVTEYRRKAKEKEDKLKKRAQIAEKCKDEIRSGLFNIFLGVRKPVLPCSYSSLGIICTNQETAERAEKLTLESVEGDDNSKIREINCMNQTQIAGFLKRTSNAMRDCKSRLVLVTGSEKLNNYLNEQKCEDVHLYSPFEDEDNYLALRGILEEKR